MKRDATQVIWRTVVFAGAMLGAPACSKKQPQTTPQNTAKPTETTTTTPTTTESKPDPAVDSCAGIEDPGSGRIRGADEDGGGGAGRGFILS